jgi:hypothetical protein
LDWPLSLTRASVTGRVRIRPVSETTKRPSNRSIDWSRSHRVPFSALPGDLTGERGETTEAIGCRQKSQLDARGGGCSRPLADRPDLEDPLATVLAVDEQAETWTFDDLEIDSGRFGELVSRGIVTAAGDGYRLADPEAVRGAPSSIRRRTPTKRPLSDCSTDSLSWLQPLSPTVERALWSL